MDPVSSDHFALVLIIITAEKPSITTVAAVATIPL